MNKKTFLIISLAALIALLSAFLITNFSDKKNAQMDAFLDREVEMQDGKVSEEINIETTEKKEERLDAEASKVKEQASIKNKQETIQEEIKNITSNKEKAVAIPQIKPLQKMLEVSIEEETIDYGLYREDSTGNIIITRHFNSKSPTKYYFKDFGVIDKAVK